MKKSINIIFVLILSAFVAFAFVGCGEKAPTPEEEATASLEATLTALQSADLETIKNMSGGDSLTEAVKSLGSEEQVQSVLKSMFGHFEYTLKTPEVVDDTHINIPATVSNADMKKAVNMWFADLMAFAMSNPDVASDEAALHAKTIEVLEESVEKVAQEEGGIVSSDVVYPMVLIDGKWEISDELDDSVTDAMLGGFVTAISGLTNGQ